MSKSPRSFTSSTTHHLPRGVSGHMLCSSTASSTLAPIHKLANALRTVERMELHAKYPMAQIKSMRCALRSHRHERISDAQVLAALDKLSRITAGDTGEAQS
jgi:hypothetical protein